MSNILTDYLKNVKGDLDRLTQLHHDWLSPPLIGAEAECKAQGGIPEYDARGEVTGCILPGQNVPVSSPQVTEPVGNISGPPQPIYIQNKDYKYTTNTTNIFNRPSDGPDIPLRRLAVSASKLPTGGGRSVSKPSKTVTVKESIADSSYGYLAHEPITNASVKLQVYKNKNLQYTEEDRKKATDLFFNWLLIKSGLPPLEEENLNTKKASDESTDEKHSLLDTALIIVPEKVKNQAKVRYTPVFGCKGIADLISNYTKRSSVTNYKVGGIIPAFYEIVDYQDSESLENKELERLELSSLGGSVETKIDRLSEAIGVDEYPAFLPPSLISTDEPAEENVSISNLTQLFGWYIQRFDEIVGQFEIPVEIKDSDPTTPGDQPTKIKLPNLAESIAEMFVLLLQTSIDTQTLVNIATRTMLETGQDKQQNYISYRLLQSLVDWAGYKVREDKEELPMLFNPGKTRFDELLVETKVQVPIVEFDEKHSLEADLMRFRKAASILDSVFYRKINPFGDIKDQMMQGLREKLGLANQINGDDDEAFKRFLNDVEIGFGNQPSVDDPTNPYGRPYEQRPKVTDITNYVPPEQP